MKYNGFQYGGWVEFLDKSRVGFRYGVEGQGWVSRSNFGMGVEVGVGVGVGVGVVFRDEGRCRVSRRRSGSGQVTGRVGSGFRNGVRFEFRDGGRVSKWRLGLIFRTGVGIGFRDVGWGRILRLALGLGSGFGIWFGLGFGFWGQG
ncbi:hypothetical protein TIFTF001_010958 [Ficus carica]|uniref:Uncharacterized protein n=1 Tax=Ficus carica TaxID=3494 RepID=A0AA87ZZ19_FICCA|nr:hypothetical protein TIFTF001_010958 [Ficus carica]